MSLYQHKTPIKSDCSIEKALLVISGKWKPAILSELLKRNLRLKDIQLGLPEAPKRALTQQLNEMVKDGLISKMDFNQFPKKTEYSLTPLGHLLNPVFRELGNFGDNMWWGINFPLFDIDPKGDRFAPGLTYSTMNLTGVIIQGSSRSDGNTGKVVSFVKERTGFQVIDLKTKSIYPFDYDYKNKHDDFIPLMKEIVASYDIILFATPVYWYTMSGVMKTFFDRITDCLKSEKEIGRKLRGKKMGVLSCGSDAELKTGFNMPFIESAHYLGMEYIGDFHTWLDGDEMPSQLRRDLSIFISRNVNKGKSFRIGRATK